jgi:hypothetical protein
VYQAVLTLTAKSGFTFTGLAVNSFSYTGATSVTFGANSRSVTITFPKTASTAPNPGGGDQASKLLGTWVATNSNE